MTAEKYRELFRLRAQGDLEAMECTKSLAKFMQNLNISQGKLLDVACGVGHYFRELKKIGNFDYIGIDLDDKAIEIAKEVWKESPNTMFIVQNASKLDFEDNSFDIVISYNLLLHLRDYKDVLKELFRVTKKHLIIRSLFDEKESRNELDAQKDYNNVYPSGKFYYNTYSRNDVSNFLKSLGSCKIKFISDNIKIPENILKKQEEKLDVDKKEFATGKQGEKQEWKGLSLNYEILLIEKR